MFAFAIWDRKEKSLFLARDRYGIKPLYYSEQGGTIAFGSEQKAILALPDFERQLDKRALLEYFTFQNLFTDRTLLRDIHLLPGGHYARFSLGAETPALRITRYWDYRFREPDQPARKEEYLEELDRLPSGGNRQLVGDVELGSYLSGGMDSGSITAIAASSYPNLKTFTCGFDLSSASGIELAFDERPKAEAMSARLTEHYEMVLKAGDMERCLPMVARHLEEPRVGQSYPNYYAAKLAGKFVKVVLSGSGGDELLGGYPWRYYRAAVNQDFERLHRSILRLLAATGQQQRLEEDVCPGPVGGRMMCWTRDIFRDVFATHDNTLERPEDYINHSLYFEAKTFLHGLFVVEDKLSMAHGLENRVPFMDNDLVDFAMQCPVGLKLNNLAEVLRINENEPGSKPRQFFEKTNDGKQILRDMMGRYIRRR